MHFYRKLFIKFRRLIKIDSLQKRLMVYSFLLLFVVISMCVAGSSYLCRRTVINELKTINEGTTSGVVVRINMMFDEFISILNIVSQDKSFSGEAAKGSVSLEEASSSKSVKNPAEQSETGVNADRRLQEKLIENTLSSYIKDYGIIEAIVYIKDKEHIYAGFNSLFYLSDEGYKNPATYKELGDIYARLKHENAGAKGIYFSRLNISGSSRFVVFKPVETPSGNTEYFLISLKEDFLENVKFNATYAYMVKSSYMINLSNSKINDTSVVQQDSDKRLTGDFLVFRKKVEMDDWKLVFIIDIKDVLGEISTVSNIFIIFSVGYILMVMVISLKYTKRLTRYIKMLQGFISSVVKSNFSDYRPFQKNTRNHFKKAFRLRTKMLLYFFTIIIIPVVTITVATYHESTSIITEKGGLDIENNIKSAAYQVNFVMDSYLKTCMSISTTSDIYQYMKMKEAYRGDFSTERAYLSNLMINRLIFYKDIVNVSIYDNNGDLSFTLVNNNDKDYKDEIREEITYLKVNSTDKVWKRLSWNYFSNDFFHIAMRLRDLDSNPIGYLMLDFNTSQIRDIFRETVGTSKMSLYLLDLQGNQVLAKENNDISVSNGNIDYMIRNDNGSLKQSKGDTLYYINFYDLDVNQWKLVASVPINDYLKSSQTIFLYNAVMLLLYILVIVIMGLKFSSSASKNLNRLKEGAEALRQGELGNISIEKTGDEIEELGHMFNAMADNIRNLINEVYVTEIKVKEAQFNALQAQINPHFLYNTLETIHYMIVIGDKRAIEMVQLLGDLFRVGISRGEKFVTVEQEINHVRLYLEIQRIRYSNRFKVVFDIDEAINSLYTIKFLLQPIVENAIYHGIELMEDEGLITITGKLENGNLKLCVSDNGEGMDAHTLNDLYDKLEGRVKSKSIGFLNVHDRIRLYFGSQYGLKVESIVNKGTEVTILLPVLRENPEWNDQK